MLEQLHHIPHPPPVNQPATLLLGNLARHVETAQGPFQRVDVHLQTCARVSRRQRHICQLEANIRLKATDPEIVADWRGIGH